MTNDINLDTQSQRQISASKTSAIAVTVLNYGSWFALVLQTSKFTEVDASAPTLCWGFGALLGTFIWIFIYRVTLLQCKHNCDRTNEKLKRKLQRNITYGENCAILSILAFGFGVVALAGMLTSY
ncbi:hypothetical protein [Celeribacter halophilus]|uniref:hypothetical protein n=1 Tax=Celeribacter halophilus TaxID=576117 RepID=UPI003A8F8DD8